MSTLLQVLFSSLEYGGIYALAALGIIIIFRTSVMTNFAQGSLGMFAAYIGAFTIVNGTLLNKLFTDVLGLDFVPTWLAAIVAMLAAFLIGVMIDIIIIRQAKNVSPVSKQIITLGLITLLAGLAPLVFGNTPRSFPRFIPKIDLDGRLYKIISSIFPDATEYGINIGGANLTYNGLFNIILGIAIMLILFFFLQKTKWGLAVRVTASNEPTARLMGVPTKTVTMGAWAVAAALGTLSALMVAPTSQVSVTMMASVQVIALIACVLGGFQTFYGPVVGAYIIGFVRNLLLVYVSTTWGEQLVYIAILLFIVIRPYGIFGKKIVKKV